MIIFLIVVLILALVLLAGQGWVLFKVVRQNESLRIVVESRDRDLLTTRALLDEVLEMKSREVKDMSAALEMVLKDVDLERKPEDAGETHNSETSMVE